MTFNNDNLNFNSNLSYETFRALSWAPISGVESDMPLPLSNGSPATDSAPPNPPMSDATQHEYVAIAIHPAVPPKRKRKSVCERVGDFVPTVTPLFSLKYRWESCRKKGSGAIQKSMSAISRLSKRAKTQETQKTQESMSMNIDSFLQTLQSIKKDKDLIVFFKKLPSDLQEELFLTGSVSEQADLIRVLLREIPQERLEKITQLDLSHSNLTSIPEEIRYFTGLIELDLSHNNITDMAPVLPLSKLKRLLLPNNEISEIPSLLSLSKLTYLSIYFNRIRPTEEMIMQIPEGLRQSIILQLQNQNLPGKISIPESWRTTSYSNLPTDTIEITAEYLSSLETRLISNEWRQATDQVYKDLLRQFQSSPILRRWIESPNLENANPIEIASKIKRELKALGIPFALDVAVLEQTIKDRSLILLFRRLPDELRWNHFLLEETTNTSAAQIRIWMENHTQELSQVAGLDLRNLNLLIIPEEIKYFTGLTHLNLKNNQIQQIDVLSTLVNLTDLDLDNN